MFAARFSKFSNPRNFITSGGLGTMGFGLPAAIGAICGKKEKDVIIFTGDGGFQMSIHELGTIMKYNLPVKIVVLNNSFLGMVRQWQELFFEKRYSFTEMDNPDFSKIAQAYGILSYKIMNFNDLESKIKEMISHKGPILLEIDVTKEENIFPMVPAGKSLDELITQ
jgi:acetolactate synthase-1/2/3 large subunit